MKLLLILFVVSSGLFPSMLTAEQPAHPARVYFITPEDGAMVASPLIVRFGLQNWGIAPAGVDKARTGHHHLLIRQGNRAVPLPPQDEPIVQDESNLHFGGGQTETTVSLTKGTYSLRLVLGDANHYPIPDLHSDSITITVQ